LSFIAKTAALASRNSRIGSTRARQTGGLVFDFTALSLNGAVERKRRVVEM
jgi:hypothetical protein